MRVFVWLKTRWYNHKTWKAFKRDTIQKYGNPGFNDVKYRGKSVDRGVLPPKVYLPMSPQPKIDLASNPIAKSVDDLLKAVDEEEKPSFSERQARLDIIKKRAGVI